MKKTCPNSRTECVTLCSACPPRKPFPTDFARIEHAGLDANTHCCRYSRRGACDAKLSQRNTMMKTKRPTFGNPSKKGNICIRRKIPTLEVNMQIELSLTNANRLRENSKRSLSTEGTGNKANLVSFVHPAAGYPREDELGGWQTGQQSIANCCLALFERSKVSHSKRSRSVLGRVVHEEWLHNQCSKIRRNNSPVVKSCQ